jgi:uracil-DNA glycosylase
MELASYIPATWRAKLSAEIGKPYWAELEAFLTQEMASSEVFPAKEDIFSALALTAYEDVKVLLLGQDPYHDNNQAHGLCFSVRPGITPPPSLKNIYKELQSDLGQTPPKHGYLESWAKQGVLMLNAVLTVRAHEANSHKERGWEKFTDAIIKLLNDRPQGVVFLLWGGYAKKKAKLIKGKQHLVITSAHPSPLSAHSGFFGSKPFTGVNAALTQLGAAPIDWTLPQTV